MNLPNGLSYAMAAYRSNSNDENLGDIYNELINADFIVPLILPFEAKEGQEIPLDNSTPIQFCILKNADGLKYLLLFTTSDKFDDWSTNPNINYTTLGFQHIVNILKKEEDISGILVDPRDGNMVFERELLFTLEEIDNESGTLN